MEMEESFCQMSADNPFLDQFSVDFMEDDDNETVIDSDYNEDNQIFDDLNQIQKIIEESEDKSSEQNSEETDESVDEVVTNAMDDDLLMGSQLLANKYRNNRQNSDESDVHKKCEEERQREREIRICLRMELELERQQRIQFQRQLERHMSYSLRKEFDDSKQIKSLKLEVFKCRQQLKYLKKSNNGSNDTNIDSNESIIDSEKDPKKSCSDCDSVMKSEVSMILHLINHCIEEEEFQLETQVFRLDEFTDSMIDSIRKSVSYCCPRCNLTFNCLEIYYHLYKYHSKEKPLLCTKCRVYCTHLDYWTEHIQSLHKGIIQSLTYVDIGQYDRNSNGSTSKASNGNRGSTECRPNNNNLKTTINNHFNGYRLRSVQNRQNKCSLSYDNRSESSSSPEVIQLSDSPPHQSPIQSNYRPIPLKPSLAVRCIPIQSEFKCDFPGCDFKTTSRDKLSFHTSAHTNSKFKCPYCPYVGNILNDIIRHIQKSKKHDGLNVYECRECSYGTNCLSSFKEHLSHKHFNSDSEEEEDIQQYVTDMFRNEHSIKDNNKTKS